MAEQEIVGGGWKRNTSCISSLMYSQEVKQEVNPEGKKIILNEWLHCLILVALHCKSWWFTNGFTSFPAWSNHEVRLTIY